MIGLKKIKAKGIIKFLNDFFYIIEPILIWFMFRYISIEIMKNSLDSSNGKLTFFIISFLICIILIGIICYSTMVYRLIYENENRQ